MINMPVIVRFESIVQKYPKNVAIITEHETVTYLELNQRANQLAHYIQDSGLNYQNAIGVCLSPSIDMVVSVLAIQKLGVPYVPIDKSYPDERINYMIKNAGISCLLTDKSFEKEIELTNTDKLYLDMVNYRKCETENLAKKNSDIVYILYTSGSTGKPKGVEVYQSGLANYLKYCCDKYLVKNAKTDNPASFIHLPLAFDASVTSLYTPLMEGRSIIIPTKQGLEVFDDLLIQNSTFDFVKMTPAHLLILKEQICSTLLEKWTRYLVVGGEVLTTQHLSYYKKIGLNWTIVNEYGPTETVVGSTTFFFSLNMLGDSKIPIGKPIYNTDVYIVNDRDELVENGQIGEIVIGGAGVAKGYCNKLQLTKERFIEDYIAPGNRVYKTGDLGMYREDGELLYCGRIDDQVKIRGYRIELTDIEVGLKKISGIVDSAVIVRETGQNTNTIEAFFVSEKEMNINDIRAELSEYLPEYMLPSKYFRITRIPVTTNGKVDRKALAAMKEESIQSEEDLSITEKKLLPLWREVLKNNNIKPTDKFSILGGHSLLAVMLIAKINKEFSIKLPILSLYPNGTLRGVARQIENEMVKNEEDI